MTETDFAAANLECDVVMKGGITSGVVYPSAVAKLATQYKFRSIGGTSAGAIAAAVTAAAEYCRRKGSGAGFVKVSDIPGWLAQGKNLLSLFKPNTTTKPLFDFLVAATSGGPGITTLLTALYTSFWKLAAPSSLPGIAIIVYAIVSERRIHSEAMVWAIVAGALIAIVLPLATTVMFGLKRQLLTILPQNAYGMCTGLKDSDAADTSTLTSWLSAQIDEVGGVDSRWYPLTFGDLWDPSAPDILDAKDLEFPTLATERAIDLQMITTNVTHGRPYRLPFETNAFFFDPTEMRKLFPERVVAWMERASRSTEDTAEQAQFTALLPRRPLPLPQHLPIVVAARMSLSFPLLISAVPLHAIDWSRTKNAKPNPPSLDPCWFSDGGLSSNFPIHFFDAPIPSRPTFGINLRPFHPDYPYDDKVECNNVWMPRNNKSSILENWNPFEKDGASLPGFLSAIFNSMQNWEDNMQSRVPGFRDRIVHVFLRDSEGGLNLNMDTKILQALSVRGICAADLIATHFQAIDPPSCGSKTPQPLNWNNHKWIRFRTAMTLLERWSKAFDKNYSKDPGYAALAAREIGTPPCSYPWATQAQQQYAVTEIAAFATMAHQWATSAQTFEKNTPRPIPELATRPST